MKIDSDSVGFSLWSSVALAALRTQMMGGWQCLSMQNNTFKVKIFNYIWSIDIKRNQELMSSFPSEWSGALYIILDADPKLPQEAQEKPFGNLTPS